VKKTFSSDLCNYVLDIWLLHLRKQNFGKSLAKYS